MRIGNLIKRAIKAFRQSCPHAYGSPATESDMKGSRLGHNGRPMKKKYRHHRSLYRV